MCEAVSINCWILWAVAWFIIKTTDGFRIWVDHWEVVELWERTWLAERGHWKWYQLYHALLPFLNSCFCFLDTVLRATLPHSFFLQLHLTSGPKVTEIPTRTRNRCRNNSSLTLFLPKTPGKAGFRCSLPCAHPPVTSCVLLSWVACLLFLLHGNPQGQTGDTTEPERIKEVTVGFSWLLL